MFTEVDEFNKFCLPDNNCPSELTNKDKLCVRKNVFEFYTSFSITYDIPNKHHAYIIKNRNY